MAWNFGIVQLNIHKLKGRAVAIEQIKIPSRKFLPKAAFVLRWHRQAWAASPLSGAASPSLATLPPPSGNESVKLRARNCARVATLGAGG